jgi:hypothetical protein
VVDDLPPTLRRTELDQWIAPHPLGKTLITTRSREHNGYGSVVDLGTLPDDEGLSLLELHWPPRSPEERAEARELARDLGSLPLALDVAGAALRRSAGLTSYRDYRAKLKHPGKDVLELAARLAGELPTGHTGSVAATLVSSLTDLEPEGLDLLRLAAQAGPSAIPPDLVVGTLALADGVDLDTAGDRAALAFQQCEVRSLSEPLSRNGQVAQRIHALVGRAVRLYDQRQDRQQRLRVALVDALRGALPQVDDVRRHAALALHVAHARFLVSGLALDPPAIELLGWVARFDLEGGHYQSAEELSRRRAAACVELFGPDHEQTLLAEGDLARTLGMLGREAEQIALSQRILEGRQRLLGPEHVDTLTAMNNLAVALSGGYDVPRALELQAKVLKVRRRTLGPEHDHTLFAMNNYGATLVQVGEYRKARAALEDTYRARCKVLGPDHQSTLSSGASLADLMLLQGEAGGAIALMRDVVKGRQSVLGAEHPRTLLSECSLGRMLIGAGDLPAAKDLLEHTLVGARQRLGESHETTLLAKNNLARALLELGDVGRSRSLLEDAVAGQRQAVGDRDEFTVRYAYNLYEVLVRQGDTATAQAIRHELLQWLSESDPSVLAGGFRDTRDKLAMLDRRNPTSTL